MNRVIISGTLDAIEQRTTSSGKLYCNFWINNEVTKGKVEQHKCQVWGDMAEWLIENVEESSTILIDGRLRNGWEDNTIIMVTSIDKWGELSEERKESEEEYEEEPTEASKQDAQINIPDTTGFPEGSFKLKDIDTDELPFY